MKRNTADDKQAPESVAVDKTKGLKDILIERTKDGRFFTIRFDTGGELPHELQGIFTSFVNANNAVKDYMARKGFV